MHQTKTRKKLIEVALPLDAINAASAREKSIRHGHPSTLHLWWARRPLAAARAVLFAQLVDDPSGVPEEFPRRGGADQRAGTALRNNRRTGPLGEHNQRKCTGEGPRRDPPQLAPHLRRQSRPPPRRRSLRPRQAARLPRPFRRRRRHPPRSPAPRPRKLRQRPQSRSPFSSTRL